jgi:hypothetical protein
MKKTPPNYREVSTCEVCKHVKIVGFYPVTNTPSLACFQTDGFHAVCSNTVCDNFKPRNK